MIDMTKYKFYNYTGKPEVDGGKQTVCAASTYAGKTVKGYAKCDPRDKFDIEAGKKLAAARCNEKVAEKRLARATMKLREADAQFHKALQYLNQMKEYHEDSFHAVIAAEDEVNKLLNEM